MLNPVRDRAGELSNAVGGAQRAASFIELARAQPPCFAFGDVRGVKRSRVWPNQYWISFRASPRLP
jgi:hypothetical protein